MQRIIIIDDTKCKPSLENFLKLLGTHVQYDVAITGNSLPKQLLLDSITEIPGQKKLTVKSGGSNYLVSFSEIIRVEAIRGKSLLILSNSNSLRTNEDIRYWQNKLGEHGFLRVHHDHLVSISAIMKLQFGEEPFLELNDGVKIPVDFIRQERIAGDLESFLF
ncbi:MAG: LytTR family transcriptional regulator DNA-binding domain-containing protein [Bacteroidales bacterium]|nr:LytTR family transcriptional regulator DNA-binding domain-containing protein [Bacteroidales bacterium]